MLLAPALGFPLTLPRPFAPAACGAAQPWHRAGPQYPQDGGSLLPTDRGLFPAETWACRNSHGPALPALVPVGSGREGAVSLCGGTESSGVAGTTVSTSPSPELALPSSACRALGSSSTSWRCCSPSQLCPGANKGPGSVSSPPPLTLLCPTGSQCHIPCPGISSPAVARLWGIPTTPSHKQWVKGAWPVNWCL